ncbi:VOC family protein [Reyranella sp.]|uniref:VOC family protein n=1 Tax=Reyranella sp. TaxID=1929291 RepID=UPI003D0F47A6
MAVEGKESVGQIGISLIVQDVAAAADFYRDVIGAEEIRRSFAHNPGEPPGPEPLGAELLLSGARLYVAKENPRWREAPRPDWPRSPLSAGASSGFLIVYVDDVDDVFARALAAGATSLARGQGPEETYWGDKVVRIIDPFGHGWVLQSRLEDVAEAHLAVRFEAQRDRLRAGRAAPPA